MTIVQKLHWVSWIHCRKNNPKRKRNDSKKKHRFFSFIEKRKDHNTYWTFPIYLTTIKLTMHSLFIVFYCVLNVYALTMSISATVRFYKISFSFHWKKKKQKKGTECEWESRIHREKEEKFTDIYTKENE